MVSRHGDDREFINVAWTLQIIRGLLIWLLCCALAYPMSVVYEASELLLLIPVVGLTAIIQGFTSPAVLTLKRKVDLQKLVSWQISTQLLTTVITILFAWYFRSIWGIVYGGLIGAIIACLSSFRLPFSGKLRIKLNSKSSGEIFHFGKWIFVSSFISFLISKGDIFILGVFLTKADLGVFSIAAIWSKMSLDLLQKVNQEVMTPLYAKAFHENRISVKEKIKKARFILLAFTLPMVWLMVMVAPFLIDFLYDERYSNAGWMLQILAVGSIGAAITATSGNALLSFGDSFGYMIFQIASGILMVLSMFFGGYYYGVVGLIAGVSIAKFLSYPVIALLMRRHKIWLPRLDGLAAISSLLAVGGWWFYIA